ncbi:MAG: hypothetical protein A3E85_00840 [Gammaproteobacteria bacterium RIFCSPHIGHO2_12_FULL_45_12]|nr:MAG: hypothetical protein A3E85_00840 [Gammaproteobacteria bacterium RIFCSPHIGHO2_12_FULL_45_12]
MRHINRLKKFLLLLGAAGTLSFFCLSDSRADDSGISNAYLKSIMDNTREILDRVNNLPDFITLVGKEVQSWLTEDKSISTALMQMNFTLMGNGFMQAADPNQNLQLTAALFGSPSQPLPLSLFASDHPAVLKIIPNINDLTFSSTLGLPPAPKASNVASAANNYIMNASGFGLNHPIAEAGWAGKQPDIDNYMAYYNTVMSVESFNGYALANSNNSTTSIAQAALIGQASSSKWFTQVATEELGIVLRQLLMFQSQMYILLSKLLDAQKQLLTAQAMTNTLLITNNRVNESYLLSKAQGISPG